jgi:hypothetical protein
VAASLVRGANVESAPGWLCQKLRMPKAMPPAGPTEVAESAGAVAAALSSQAWPSPVRLRMVKESAFGCDSVQSPKRGTYCSRSCTAGAMDGTAWPSICACRAAAPGSRRRPVRPRTASPNKPSSSPRSARGDRAARLHGHVEAQADAADEVLRLVAVEHDGVQHAQRVAAGVEIETQRERQPAPFAVRMPAFDLDHRARGSALFEHGLLDHALEFLQPDLRGIRAGAVILATAAPALPARSASRPSRVMEVITLAAGVREAAHEGAGVDLDAAVVSRATMLRGEAGAPRCGITSKGPSPRFHRGSAWAVHLSEPSGHQASGQLCSGSSSSGPRSAKCFAGFSLPRGQGVPQVTPCRIAADRPSSQRTQLPGPGWRIDSGEASPARGIASEAPARQS